MRKKEIEKESICQYQIIGTIGEQEAFKNGFVKGAEWADKTMIDKACQWLMKYFVLDHEGMSPSGYGVFEYMFRKAMEE